MNDGSPKLKFGSRFGMLLAVIVGVLGASLSACVREDATSPKTAGGIVLAAASWMTLPAAFVDVHYVPAYTSDAELTRLRASSSRYVIRFSAPSSARLSTHVVQEDSSPARLSRQV